MLNVANICFLFLHFLCKVCKTFILSTIWDIKCNIQRFIIAIVLFFKQMGQRDPVKLNVWQIFMLPLGGGGIV